MLLHTKGKGYHTPYGTFTPLRAEARRYTENEVILTEDQTWVPRFLTRLGLVEQAMAFIDVLCPYHDPEEELFWIVSLERVKALSGQGALAYELLHRGMPKTDRILAQHWLDQQESDDSIEAILSELFRDTDS